MNKTCTKIIKTAEQLIWDQGYEGASLNEIVAKAGISKGGLFHYYPNKKSVSLAVLEQYFNEQILDPLNRHLAHPNVKVGLLNWLEETYGAYANKGFNGGCLLGNFALETADQDEELRETVKTMFLTWENTIVSALRPAAQEDKLLMEARQLARLIVAMFQGITMTSKVNKDHIRASRDFQALAELIERMIRD